MRTPALRATRPPVSSSRSVARTHRCCHIATTRPRRDRNAQNGQPLDGLARTARCPVMRFLFVSFRALPLAEDSTSIPARRVAPGNTRANPAARVGRLCTDLAARNPAGRRTMSARPTFAAMHRARSSRSRFALTLRNRRPSVPTTAAATRMLPNATLANSIAASVNARTRRCGEPGRPRSPLPRRPGTSEPGSAEPPTERASTHAQFCRRRFVRELLARGSVHLGRAVRESS